MARDHKHYQARVTFHASGSKSDTASNSFNFLWLADLLPVTTDYNALATAVKGFYTTGSPLIKTYLGSQINRGTNQVETAIYDLDLADAHHYLGSPVFIQTWTLSGASGSQPLPNECAAVFSYRAGYGTDPEHSGTNRPRASDRGRIYVGPLDASAVEGAVAPDGTIFAVLSAAFVNAMKAAGQNLGPAAFAAGWQWSVWSRKEQLFKKVLDYAVDNTTDTQRRRGADDPLQNWIAITGL